MANDTVILLHGIWMPALVMAPLAARLRRKGFETKRFSYSSLLQKPERHVERLGQLIQALPTDQPLHLVAHSLGGLVVARAVTEGLGPPIGRVVTLGTPFGGSRTAQALHDSPAKLLLGRYPEPTLLQGIESWPGPNDLGVIAGSEGVGVSSLLGLAEKPGDGTVSIAESRVDGSTARLELPLSHTQLLMSSAAAHATARFLVTGGF